MALTEAVCETNKLMTKKIFFWALSLRFFKLKTSGWALNHEKNIYFGHLNRVVWKHACHILFRETLSTFFYHPFCKKVILGSKFVFQVETRDCDISINLSRYIGICLISLYGPFFLQEHEEKFCFETWVRFFTLHGQFVESFKALCHLFSRKKKNKSKEEIRQSKVYLGWFRFNFSA